MSAELAGVLALARRGRDHGDVRAHRGGELHAHVTEPAQADDCDLAGRPHTVLAQRRVGRDAGTQQRRDAARVHSVRNLQAEVVANDDMVGVAALADRVVVIVGAVVRLDAALAAEHLPAGEALVALHAAVDHATDRDRVADAVAGDFVADRGDRADDLVTRDARVDRALPVVAAGMEVAVANAGVGDLDRDIVWPERAALEVHRAERLVGRIGAPALATVGPLA